MSTNLIPAFRSYDATPVEIKRHIVKDRGGRIQCLLIRNRLELKTLNEYAKKVLVTSNAEDDLRLVARVLERIKVNIIKQANRNWGARLWFFIRGGDYYVYQTNKLIGNLIRKADNIARNRLPSQSRMSLLPPSVPISSAPSRLPPSIPIPSPIHENIATATNSLLNTPVGTYAFFFEPTTSLVYVMVKVAPSFSLKIPTMRLEYFNKRTLSTIHSRNGQLVALGDYIIGEYLGGDGRSRAIQALNESTAGSFKIVQTVDTVRGTINQAILYKQEDGTIAERLIPRDQENIFAIIAQCILDATSRITNRANARARKIIAEIAQPFETRTSDIPGGASIPDTKLTIKEIESHMQRIVTENRLDRFPGINGSAKIEQQTILKFLEKYQRDLQIFLTRGGVGNLSDIELLTKWTAFTRSYLHPNL